MKGSGKRGYSSTKQGASFPWRSSHHGKARKPWSESWWRNATAPVPLSLGSLTRFCLKSALGITIALYILNQKHLLPKPLSAVVSKTLFWPTLPITVGRRLGKWCTEVDETVVMGGAPFGFANLPERLYEKYGVRGVVNLCAEYAGPVQKYKELGISYLDIPTVDHFEPSVRDMERAVNFIQKFKNRGERVYVHCRAGHGRSAAVVMAWLLTKYPESDRKELNVELCMLRDVRKTLWKQPKLSEFHARLLERVSKSDDDDDDDDAES